MDIIIYGAIFIGAALMIANIIRFILPELKQPGRCLVFFNLSPGMKPNPSIPGFLF